MIDHTIIEYAGAQLEDEPSVKAILKLLDGDESAFDIEKFVVAKVYGRTIGCIRVKSLPGETLELSSLAVLPEFQHNGIGSELIRKLLESEPARPIYLLTSADKARFYQKFDFRLIKPEEAALEFRAEYRRIVAMPFAKNLQVIIMMMNN
jgi:N-acetylglutamate synthase-like GNAT family acetyltransferase